MGELKKKWGNDSCISDVFRSHAKLPFLPIVLLIFADVHVYPLPSSMHILPSPPASFSFLFAKADL